MHRLRFLAAFLVVGVMTGGLLLGQDKKSDDKKSDDREPIIVKSQMPRYFSKLGLSASQKKEVYKVKANYAAKIEELNKQIQALKDQEKVDLEKVLTEAQRTQLKALQSGGGKDKETTAKPEAVKK